MHPMPITGEVQMQLHCDSAQTMFPWPSHTSPRRARPRHLRPTSTPSREQLLLFPPSVMRRVSVRRRTTYRFIGIRGLPVVRTVVDTVPVVRPTSADDAGLPDWNRWTPPRHARTFDTLRYEDDLDIRRFVATHEDGASLGEIAEHIGWSKQGVMEVERRGLRKLVALAMKHEWAAEWMATVLGLELEDLREALNRRSAC